MTPETFLGLAIGAITGAWTFALVIAYIHRKLQSNG